MTTNTFIKPRQQTAAFALSTTFTLAMLLAMNMLATQPAVDANLAAAAAQQQQAQAAQQLRG
jgi:hypothetical protein